MRTQATWPEKWANTQEFLGHAYSMRVDGEPVENRKLAMQCYRAGLEVYTRENNPAKWATLQLNLGVAYINDDSDPGRLILDYQKGVEHLQNALQATDILNRPYERAMIQMNLGTAFSLRQPEEGESNKDEVEERNKEKALELFREAASVYTKEAYPADCRRLQMKLGRVLYELHRYPESRAAFEEAHRANELLRSGWQRPGARKELSASNTLMYRKLVYCCLMENDTGAAFYYATAAKSRSLLDGLNMPAESIEKLLAADEALAADWVRIVQERARLDALSVQFERQVTKAGRERLLTLMRDQRGVLDDLLDEAMFNYPKLISREAARLFSPEELQRMSADLGNIPMIEYYRHEGGWSAFVVSASQVEHVSLPEDTDRIVDGLSRWIVRYGNDRSILADEKLTHDALFLMFEYFIRPLAKILPKAGKLVIAPFDQQHLFPLHCALELGANRFLWEDYCITYIPGLQALRLLQEQQKRDRAQRSGVVRIDSLLSVAYTAADLGRGLQHVLAEADAIRNYFAPPPRSIYLEEDAASPEEVLIIGRDKAFSTLHFGCHGFFDFDDAEHSGLLLNGGWLTIDRIQTELRLMHYPMVVLSACETGRSLQEGGDNSTGLIQSFLTSGAGAVVASLWTVDDESTRYLFTSFYRNRQVEGLSTAEALRAAMREVSEQPGWKDPFYWAAFRVTGVPEGSK